MTLSLEQEQVILGFVLALSIILKIQKLILKLKHNQELVRHLAKIHSNDRFSMLEYKCRDLSLYKTVINIANILDNL